MSKLFLFLPIFCASASLGSPILNAKPPPPPPPPSGAGTWTIRLDTSAGFKGDVSALVSGVEDAFSPFNVNVTTSPVSGSNVKTCYVGGSSGGLYGGLTPVVGGPTCYVYSDEFSGNLLWIYEAIVHEVGHTFGLLHQHDPVTGAEYYAGDGVNAPFMGIPYYARSRWWQSSSQDDLARLDSAIGRRVDDYPSTAATALSITGSITGTIERSTDEDWFKVPAGSVASLALPAGGMLTATLEQTGELVRVRGTGEYNSIGSYVVNVIAVPEPAAGLFIFAIFGFAARATSRRSRSRR